MTIIMSVPKGAAMTERERSEHEHYWISSPGTTPQHHRVVWRQERMMWWPQFKTSDGLWAWDSGSIIWAAAEIAKLKGLVPPGGEGA